MNDISYTSKVSKLLLMHLQCLPEWQQWSVSCIFTLTRRTEKEHRPRLEHRQHLYQIYQSASLTIHRIEGHLPKVTHLWMRPEYSCFKCRKCRLIQSEREKRNHKLVWKSPKLFFSVQITRDIQHNIQYITLILP